MSDSPDRRGRVPILALLFIAAAAGAAGWFAGRYARTPERPTTAAATSAARVWTCGMHPQVLRDAPGLCPICHMELTPLDTTADAGGLAIDPAVVQRMGITVVPVRRAALARTVRAQGSLFEREPDRRDVTLRVGGWIERLHAATEGARVNAGDPLFDLYSPELTVAIEELLSAGRALAANPASGSASTVRDASRRRLEFLGLAIEQVAELETLANAPRAVTFRAPVGGIVSARRVYAGARIEPGQAALTLSDNRVLWLDARVYEQDLVLVREGQAVRARVAAAPGERVEGTVLFVHPDLDPRTRSALVRAEVQNEGGRLRQGMSAVAEIATDAPEGASGDALVVPRSAVIDTGLRRVVFVSLGEGRFEARDVESGRSGDGGLVQVLAGLAEGDLVVTSGQFLLDAESRTRDAIRRYQQRDAPVASEPAGAPPAGARASEREAPHERLDAVFAAYLAIAARLGGLDANADDFDAAPLALAARQLERDAQGDTRRLAQRIAEAAEGLARAPRPERRALFAPLSEAAIGLADRSPPSAAVAESLYVVHCPMAPGSWLAKESVVENPYYADSMKACGVVVRAIRAADGK